MRRLLLSLIVLLITATAVPAFAQDEAGTIADIVVASASSDQPQFTVLLAAVQAADPAVIEAYLGE